MTEAASERIQWARAWRALRTLIREPERTEQVFELLQASGGKRDRLFRRFRKTREGQQLLAERPALLEVLSKRDQLYALPPNSFGRAYAVFMESENLEAGGLLQAAEQVERAPSSAEERWFSERLRDMHDLWHVLTGYGRDNAGEAAVLAFSYAQTRSRGIGVIVAAALWLGPWDWSLRWQRYLFKAWRRGRRARPLMLARWEDLMALPLSEVRRELGVEPPESAHPGGLISATS